MCRIWKKNSKKKPAKKNLKTDHTTQMIMMMIMVITFIIMTCFDSNQKQINYYYYIHRWCQEQTRTGQQKKSCQESNLR